MRDADAGARLAGRRVLLDCRWLGLGGAGRLTSVLLRELTEWPPPGRWILWGDPDALADAVWASASVEASRMDPRVLFGQRQALRVPPSDVAVYMHAIRPLVPGRSVTFVHDTIPLRWGGSASVRLAKRAFLRAAARLTTRIVTGSAVSREAIRRDLGVPAERIDLVPYPVDRRFVDAVARARERLGADEVVLYVGRFDTHKNLPRLCEAFAATAFARGGGRLVLHGGLPGEVESLRRWVEGRRLGAVEVRPASGEDELVAALARCRALVLPSHEEGYGLPAFEAAAAGIPVAASRTGAIADLPSDAAVLFDPRDTDGIARAIDRATELRPPRFSLPGSDFASQVVRVVAAAAAAERRVREPR